MHSEKVFLIKFPLQISILWDIQFVFYEIFSSKLR